MPASFSPDGRLLATCGVAEPDISLWDPATGKLQRALTGHQSGVISVSFSPDGRRLASGGLDGTVKIWDPSTGKILQDFHTGRQVGGVCFSPDGQRLATGTARLNSGEDTNLWLWDTVTGQELLRFPGVGDVFWQVSFSPDGNRLAATSGSADAVLVWDASRPALPNTDKWKVLFSDDFERAKLGDRWSPATSWVVENGHLRGRMQQVPYYGLGVLTSLLAPKLKLPPTVEVRFDCWASADMNFFAMFTKDGTHQGVHAWLLGVPAHFATRGAALVWQGGLLHFPILTTNPHFEVEPNKRYNVRILREPRRLTLFVNGVEVASSALPPLETQTLSLGGMYGPAGSDVYLDNVEIRAPRDETLK
jgi:Tol biopolymer transport system component